MALQTRLVPQDLLDQITFLVPLDPFWMSSLLEVWSNLSLLYFWSSSLFLNLWNGSYLFIFWSD